MNQIILSIRIFTCILAAGITLYAHIHKRNELTELRLVLPGIEKEVKRLQRENVRLQYEVDRFESPLRLMEWARKPEFSHLKFPYVNEVVIIDAK